MNKNYHSKRRSYPRPPKRSEAGLYSFEEAEKIVESANIGLHDTPNEAIIKYK